MQIPCQKILNSFKLTKNIHFFIIRLIYYSISIDEYYYINQKKARL